MTKRPAIDKTGFDAWETLITLNLEHEAGVLALEAERLNSGVLCLAWWDEPKQANQMLFLVPVIHSADQAEAMYQHLSAYLIERRERDRDKLRATGVSDEELAEAEQNYPYRVNVSSQWTKSQVFCKAIQKRLEV